MWQSDGEFAERNEHFGTHAHVKKHSSIPVGKKDWSGPPRPLALLLVSGDVEGNEKNSHLPHGMQNGLTLKIRYGTRMRMHFRHPAIQPPSRPPFITDEPSPLEPPASRNGLELEL